VRRAKAPDIVLHGAQAPGILECLDHRVLQQPRQLVGPPRIGDVVDAPSGPATRDAIAAKARGRALDDDRQVCGQAGARLDRGGIDPVDARRRHLVLQASEAAGEERGCNGDDDRHFHGGISTPAGAGP
jgi:hypothetical protein